MKKRILYGVYYISIFLCIINSIWAFYQGSNRVETTTIIPQAVPVSKLDKIYVKNMNTILVHNQLSGIIQCFNSNGGFEWGVQLPSTKNIDSTLVSFDENNIYLWEGKTNSVYTYHNQKFSVYQENIKSVEFYKKYPLSKEYYALFKWNGVVEYGNEQVNRNIRLETNFLHYNFDDAFIGIFINFIIFAFIKRKLMYEDGQKHKGTVLLC